MRHHSTVLMQVNGDEELLQKVGFSIPAFHAYCHIPSCQVRGC